MKKIYSSLMMAMLLLSVMPMVLAEEGSIGGGVVIDAPAPTDSCSVPEIFIDHTARGWFPNDQTIYTADVYNDTIINGGKYKLGSIYTSYVVPQRQNYVFTGETVDYYVLVRDANGKADIDEVQLLVDGTAVGQCAQVDLTTGGVAVDTAAFGTTLKGTTDFTYICKLIISSTWQDAAEVSVRAIDGQASPSSCAVNIVDDNQADWLNFNPTLAVSLNGGPINFGTVAPGTNVTSNSIRIGNNAEVGSGVMMDMYIASDDYFTDTPNPSAICPTGNGIKYDRFSYYATKGSYNSGSNDNAFPGLGETVGCAKNSDEFTTLPSHSGHIEDMCRIINWNQGASLLGQGSEMTLTFKLAVPSVCEGAFTEGEFHFVGRVV